VRRAPERKFGFIAYTAEGAVDSQHRLVSSSELRLLRPLRR
jgi:hypothetical protein